MKPDIVFFGEKLSHEFDRYIEEDRDQADLMLYVFHHFKGFSSSLCSVIGSSLKVAPVSELVGFIPHAIPIILLNREPVYHLHHSFDVQLLGYCDQIVSRSSAMHYVVIKNMLHCKSHTTYHLRFSM
jgi:NAD-dependent histone deacetylase SIR2